MAPKKDKSGSSKSKSADEEHEDVLQAVVVADTFETRFAPLTFERPRCLLPLANVPLIEYTLEYLANAGVQDVFLYAGAHTDQVEKYVNASKWKTSMSPFKQLVFLRSVATSVGDVMRDLDGKNFITSDFLAVSGDIVSNFPIEDALKQHRARREKDKNAIMTMLLREGNKTASRSTTSGLPTFVIDPTKDRCLHYEEIQPGSRVHIDPDVLKGPEIDVRQDLVDCRIDICTPDVLSLWSDNFDNQSPRKEFLYGVLKDYELNGKTIHTYIIKEHYAARAANLPFYDIMSKDVSSRWTYPLCPDSNLVPTNHFQLRNGNTYQEEGVILARSCIIKEGSIIGAGSSVGDRSVVKNSVIGRGCQIGRDVKLDGTYIWDHVIIGDGSKVSKAIIADEAVIGNHCTIEAGAILSFGVRISNDIHIAAGTLITRAADNMGHHVESDEKLVGENGEGYAYNDEDGFIRTFNDKKSQGSSFYDNQAATVSVSSLSSALSSDDEASLPSHGISRNQSFGAASDVSDAEEAHLSERFQAEAVISLFERMQTNTDPDDVRVELMGLRFSNNATEHQVRRAVATALMKHIQATLDASAGSGAVQATVTKILKRYTVLIQRERAAQAVEENVDFMLSAQKDLVHRVDGERILLFVAKDLYDRDVFDEDVFTSWWNDERSSATEAMRMVRETTRQFVEWLENAEEESEEDEEEESEEEG